MRLICHQAQPSPYENIIATDLLELGDFFTYRHDASGRSRVEWAYDSVVKSFDSGRQV